MTETVEIRPENAAALAALYLTHREEFTAKAAQLLRVRGIPEAVVGAEDLVQMVFENALRTPQVLREPRAYLYTALRREVGHRAERLHQEREWEATHQREENPDASPGPDVGAVVTDRVVVRDAVRRLPEQQRAAVVATKMFDFTQQETAQLMKRHPGTVAVHVARAVGMLALYLTPGVAIIVVCALVPMLGGSHLAIFLLSDLAYLWAIRDHMDRSETVQKIKRLVMSDAITFRTERVSPWYGSTGETILVCRHEATGKEMWVLLPEVKIMGERPMLRARAASALR
ncbi:RNA polymerase sigma factor [Streptomyces sp. R28]|uniref:RNA polymerase sigma factor n=1 Tax=Streptomyces sp. R28 TaxID=3238628 RepID=A0AB39PLH5_9ACTN